MSQARFDDDELFAEATEDIQANIQESISEASDSLPTEDQILNIDSDGLISVLESVDAKVKPELVNESLTDAKKRFLLGQSADAFDKDYIENTEASIRELQQKITLLQEIEQHTTELTDAVGEFVEDNSFSEDPNPTDESDDEASSTTTEDDPTDNAETEDAQQQDESEPDTNTDQESTDGSSEESADSDLDSGTEETMAEQPELTDAAEE